MDASSCTMVSRDMDTAFDHEPRGTSSDVRQSAPKIARQRALDVVRGGIMVLMVLDHARDFGFGVDPTDLEETTPILFFTRWITHFCAPGFIFLAGASAYLYGRKRTPRE